MFDNRCFSLTIPSEGLSLRQISAHPSFTLIDGVGICLYDNFLPGCRKNNDCRILERIVKAYKKSDKDILSDLGYHASLIIADCRKNKLLISSDMVGHFTYYFAIKNRSVTVSSDISFCSHNLTPDISKESFTKYFLKGYIYGDDTVFSGIKKIQPGCYLVVDKGKLIVRSYHRYCSKLIFRNEKWFKESILKGLKDFISVYAKNRKVGLMLSGGYDSSFLCGKIAKECRELHTFTLGIESCVSNAVLQSRKIAKLFKTFHHEINLTNREYVAAFAEVMGYLDEPVFDMDIAIIFSMLGSIPEDIDFIFHGFGSDELFGDRLKSSTGRYDGRCFYMFAGQKLPQELLLHERVCSTHHSRLIFPFVAHSMVKLALEMPLGFKQGKNLLRSLATDLDKVHFEPNLPVSRIPELAKKTIIAHYLPKVERSQCLGALLGKNDLKEILRRSTNRQILSLIVFQVWFERRFPGIVW